MNEFFNDYVQTLETYIMFRIKETTAKLAPELKAKGRAPISLSMGAPTAAPPKFVIESLTKALSLEGIHTYSSPKGENFFREAVAKRMKERFNVELNPADEIFSLIGSKEGIANFIRALINPSLKKEEQDIILIPDPGYASYGEMIKVSGGLSYPVPLTVENNFMPDLEQVYANLIKDGYNPKKVKALLINYPNNPLGATATREYLESVVAFCKKHHILLMSDAAYTEMYFKPELKPMSILEIEGAKDIAVEFFSFSKPYAMTGWRIGFMAAPLWLAKACNKLQGQYTSGPSSIAQKASVEAFNGPQECVQEMCEAFRRRRDLIVGLLKEIPGLRLNLPDGAFYVFPEVSAYFGKHCGNRVIGDANDLAMYLLEEAHVAAVSGDAFCAPGYIRLSYATSDENIREACRRIAAALGKLED